MPVWRSPGRDALAAVIERISRRDPKTVSRLFRVLVVEDNKHVSQLIQEGLRGSTRRDFGGGVSFVFRGAEDGLTATSCTRSSATRSSSMSTCRSSTGQA